MVADEIALAANTSEESAVLIEFWKRDDAVRRYNVHMIKVAGRVVLRIAKHTNMGFAHAGILCGNCAFPA